MSEKVEQRIKEYMEKAKGIKNTLPPSTPRTNFLADNIKTQEQTDFLLRQILFNRDEHRQANSAK